MEAATLDEDAVPLHVDDRRLPLLQLTYIGDFSDNELRDFLFLLERALARPGRKVAIIDLLQATGTTAKQRRRQAQWIGDNEQILRRDVAACGIVSDSTIMRGIVTAVFWIKPLPLPTQIVSTLLEAQSWIAPHLASLYPQGVSLSR